jgi:L-ascorbate metabolism protein UlaG (beta-lactamase superfamily)
MIDHIEWLGHASFRLVGCPLIYIDPWRVTRGDKHADIILVTHDHYDHCSPADVEKLRGPDTVIITNEMAASLLDGAKTLRPWQVMNVGRVSIMAAPAYNSHHPPSFGGLGFVLSLDHYDVYYAGDTDLIPEMSRIRCDIAILPIGGRQTMSAPQAAEAVRLLRPRWAIPSHWGSPSEGGTIVDVKEFRQGAEPHAKVIVPERVR